jgi:hypoxia up-regulated 1
MHKYTLLLALIILVTSGQASLVGIDFGLDWFKVSIVKQGIPLDIVLNSESKRKSSTSIAIHKNNRIFGGSPRWPGQVFFTLDFNF